MSTNDTKTKKKIRPTPLVRLKHLTFKAYIKNKAFLIYASQDLQTNFKRIGKVRDFVASNIT